MSYEESVGPYIILSFTDNGLVNTFPWQQRTVGGIMFYSVHVISKERRQARD
jgi:hypothetical protein